MTYCAKIGMPVARDAHINFELSLSHRAIARPLPCKRDKSIGADHAVGAFPSAIASTSVSETAGARSSMKKYAEKPLLLAGASQGPWVDMANSLVCGLYGPFSDNHRCH